MKDFYDVNFFLTKLRNEIDIEIIKTAINNTFSKRGSFRYLNNYERIINSIKDNERIKKLWNTYCKKYKYAKDVDINEIFELLFNFINSLNLDLVES